MNNAERVAKGLLIFVKYDPEADCFAEHDVIYAGPKHKALEEMSDLDKRELKKLGWDFDKDNDCWRKLV